MAMEQESAVYTTMSWISILRLSYHLQCMEYKMAVAACENE